MAPISQPVVVPPSEAAVVLVLTLREGNDQAVLDAIADLTGVIRAVAFRYPDAQTTCVAGIGSAAQRHIGDLLEMHEKNMLATQDIQRRKKLADDAFARRFQAVMDKHNTANYVKS